MTTADAMTASYFTVGSSCTAEGYRTAEGYSASSADRIVELVGLTPACSTGATG